MIFICKLYTLLFICRAIYVYAERVQLSPFIHSIYKKENVMTKYKNGMLCKLEHLKCKIKAFVKCPQFGNPQATAHRELNSKPSIFPFHPGIGNFVQKNTFCNLLVFWLVCRSIYCVFCVTKVSDSTIWVNMFYYFPLLIYSGFIYLLR
jgi:hypothetical protein